MPRVWLSRLGTLSQLSRPRLQALYHVSRHRSRLEDGRPRTSTRRVVLAVPRQRTQTVRAPPSPPPPPSQNTWPLIVTLWTHCQQRCTQDFSINFYHVNFSNFSVDNNFEYLLIASRGAAMIFIRFVWYIFSMSVYQIYIFLSNPQLLQQDLIIETRSSLGVSCEM